MKNDRVSRLLEKHIEYVASPCFEDNSFSPIALCECDPDGLLSAGDETKLFRAMNWAKYHAAELRKNLTEDDPFATELVDQIDDLLREAETIRNQIVRIFMKLGASIAKRLASFEFPFDELASEAHVTLLRAVEIFDCERGFRFSTYATHAVRRNLIRYLKKRRKEKTIFSGSDALDSHPEERKWTWKYEQQVVRASSTIDGMLRRLEPRDQFILRSRFGLSGDCHGQSLQGIADVLGLSRERVRQLEGRAADRLRHMAQAEHFEPLEA